MIEATGKKVLWISALMIFLLVPSIAGAQASGSISGYVKDSSGASIAEAKVTATLTSRDTSSTAMTDSEGFYNFPALEPGAYTLAIEKSGFERSVQTGLTLTVRENLRADATLQIGAVTQQVSVTAQAPLVDTSSGTVSGLVDDRRIVDLPLNGRNVMGLAEIVPGVLGVRAPESLSDARSGPQMNVNGGRGNVNLYTFDGAYFQNPSRNTGMNYPPPDVVQEFRMQTANFDAEYGRNSGSQTAVISKSGSNSFHGDVWEFLRNDALNARNFFSPTVPSDKENQFGGTAGGPIKKDKLFYFGAFQALIKRPESVENEALVPSAAERSGDFSALLPGTVLADPTSPVTGAPLTAASGAPCVANNVINAGCLSPVTQNLLKYIPETPSGTFVSLAPIPFNDYMYFGRIDANLSSKQQLTGHVYIDHNTHADSTGGGTLTTFTHFNFAQESDMISLSDTYTIRPTLVNQAIASYLRMTSSQTSLPNITNSTLGINAPQYTSLGSIQAGVGGDFSIGDGVSFTGFYTNAYEFRDEMTWIHGAHTLKFGGELLPMHWLQRFLPPLGFSFNGARSGDPLADFMLGTYSSMGGEFGQAQNDDLTVSPSAFFQDQFKVTPRFTLTYGLRWEPERFWYDKYNRIDTVKAGAQSTVVPDAPPGVVFPGDPGVPRTIVPADWSNFAPRLSFAWDVFGDGKTSVRGGYGVFFDQINADSLAQQNAPFTGVISQFNGLIDNPFGSIGVTPPPVTPTGKFGCVKISTPPGVNCPLFPLPLFGAFVDGSLDTPYWQGWNLTVQRQVTPSTMVGVSYVGKIGTKLNNLRNFNPGVFIPGTSFNAATGVETPNSTLENFTNRVLFEPGIVSANSWTLGNDYRSWYHSLEAQVIRRLSKGVSVTASYTLSKSMDMCSAICEGCGCVSNPFNLRTMRGRSAWDRRHAFVASYLWSPPIQFSDHWKNALLGGWTFSGITTIQSGAPMTFNNGIDVAVNGTGAPEHAFLTGQPIPMSHSSRAATVNEFFNTGAFVVPTCAFTAEPGNPQAIEQQNCTPDGIRYDRLGQYGQSGRNILSGPAFSNTDVAAIKDFAFTERYRMELRGELFNVFNQVNFNNPDSTVTDSTFGQILGANSGRVVQFALKVFW